MPPEYKMDKKVHEPVHVIWRDIEKRFGLNTVAGSSSSRQQPTTTSRA
ncbi:hypothetical protein PF003_g14028 [Phytophthora fragariae]|nr:hypothetical protein PF003_g14028 [Phytophthora fragariae]